MLLTRYCIGLVRMHVVVVCSLTLVAQYPRVGLMAGAPCDCGHRSCHVCFLMWVAELGLGGMSTSYFFGCGSVLAPQGARAMAAFRDMAFAVRYLGVYGVLGGSLGACIVLGSHGAAGSWWRYLGLMSLRCCAGN